MKRTLLLLLIAFGFQSYGQNALNLDGNNDLVTTTFAGMTGTAPRTVEAWIRTTANTVPANGGRQHIITDWGNTGTGQRFTFNILFNSAIRLEVAGNGVNGTIAVNDGQWHHVAAVYDPLAANTIRLYVDGVLDVQGTPTVTVNTASGNLQIGQRIDGVNNFGGDIDEVRIWNYAVPQSQLQNYRNIEFCDTIPTGLVAYYRANSGVAGGNNSGVNTLIDYSGGGKHGTLQNFSLSGISSNWVAGAPTVGNNSDTITVTSCKSFTSPNGKVFTATGIYYDTLANTIGCDSILEIDLTILSVDTTVSIMGNVMTANQGGATYQWHDCDNGFAPVAGATSRTFTPVNANKYAVVITANGCTDTSACTSLPVGIDEYPVAPLTFYPNPTTGEITIQYPVMGNGTLVVYNAVGQAVMQMNVNSEPNLHLNLSSLQTGVYWIEIGNDEEVYRGKVVVE